MKSTQNLPTKLKELRKQNHYSQEYVAEQLNISRQAISHWENGRAYPDIDNLVLLAELYHISVDELLEDEVDVKVHNADEAITLPIIDNFEILEMLGLAIIVVLSLNVPLGAIITSIITVCWMRYKKRKYYVIYIVCVLCILVDIYDIFILISHFISYGGPKLLLLE